jgi:hypothetical protein
VVRHLLNPDKTPRLYAQLECQEGEAWFMSTENNEAENIEVAIRLLSDAGNRIKNFPPDRLSYSVKASLAHSYLRRVRDDRAANVERALSMPYALDDLIRFEEDPKIMACRCFDVSMHDNVDMLDAEMAQSYERNAVNRVMALSSGIVMKISVAFDRST